MGWMNQVCGENENEYIEINKKYLTKLEEENKNLQSELKSESESVVLLTKELEVYKKAIEYFDTLLFDHCRKDSEECFIRCGHTFERCECLKEGMWAELALKKAREEK